MSKPIIPVKLEDKSVDKGDTAVNDDIGEEADYVDRKTQSRATTNHDPDKIWTTEEILADEELWRVTDSEGDEESEIEETK